MDPKDKITEILKNIFSKGRIQTQIIIALAIVLAVFILNMLNFAFSKAAVAQVRNTLSVNTDFVSIYRNFTASSLISQPNPATNLINYLISQITGIKSSDIAGTDNFTIGADQFSDGIADINDGSENNQDSGSTDQGGDGTTNQDGKDTADLGLTDLLPVNGIVTETYGDRINPVTQKEEMHEAVDISTEEGTPIKAFNSGTVENVGWDALSGNYFSIKGEDGIETTYAHCLDIYVNDGDKVLKEDVVATVGSTGQSTGSHLHFEIIKDGQKVDPIGYVKDNNE